MLEDVEFLVSCSRTRRTVATRIASSRSPGIVRPRHERSRNPNCLFRCFANISAPLEVDEPRDASTLSGSPCEPLLGLKLRRPPSWARTAHTGRSPLRGAEHQRALAAPEKLGPAAPAARPLDGGGEEAAEVARKLRELADQVARIEKATRQLVRRFAEVCRGRVCFPRRHSHGGTAASSTHSPRLRRRASSSSLL